MSANLPKRILKVRHRSLSAGMHIPFRDMHKPQLNSLF